MKEKFKDCQGPLYPGLEKLEKKLTVF